MFVVNLREGYVLHTRFERTDDHSKSNDSSSTDVTLTVLSTGGELLGSFHVEPGASKNEGLDLEKLTLAKGLKQAPKGHLVEVLRKLDLASDMQQLGSSQKYHVFALEF